LFSDGRHADRETAFYLCERYDIQGNQSGKNSDCEVCKQPEVRQISHITNISGAKFHEKGKIPSLFVHPLFVVLIWSAIKPKDYFTWILEVTPA